MFTDVRIVKQILIRRRYDRYFEKLDFDFKV
jgi:hypothetical protein